MLGSLLVSAAVAHQVIVSARETIPASPWLETFTATCGSQQVVVSRPMRPLQDRPKILLNGRPPRGDVRALEQELDDVGAAYRFSFLCASDNGAMQLRWVSGRVGERDRVTYRAGSAVFQDGAIVLSHSEEVNAETFWYR